MIHRIHIPGVTGCMAKMNRSKSNTSSAEMKYKERDYLFYIRYLQISCSCTVGAIFIGRIFLSRGTSPESVEEVTYHTDRHRLEKE